MGHRQTGVCRRQAVEVIALGRWGAAQLQVRWRLRLQEIAALSVLAREPAQRLRAHAHVGGVTQGKTAVNATLGSA